MVSLPLRRAPSICTIYTTVGVVTCCTFVSMVSSGTPGNERSRSLGKTPVLGESDDACVVQSRKKKKWISFWIILCLTELEGSQTFPRIRERVCKILLKGEEVCRSNWSLEHGTSHWGKGTDERVRKEYIRKVWEITVKLTNEPLRPMNTRRGGSAAMAFCC